MPIFSFLQDKFSNCQGILTKIGICIDIKEIWFWIANGQISSIFDRSARDKIMAGYYHFTFLFSYILQKTGFDISSKLSPEETVCMNSQNLFSGKNNKNILKCLLKFYPVC